jgi:hypothetical protein
MASTINTSCNESHFSFGTKRSAALGWLVMAP